MFNVAREVTRLSEDIDPEILQSFNLQKTLNPSIWDDFELKEDVRKYLVQIAKDFYEYLEISAKVADIVITGSIANFNWSKYSDIDLHLRIRFTDVDENEELVMQYFQAKKTIWNTQHDIKIHGFPVEVYVENTTEAHISTAVYSLLNDKWVIKPQLVNHKLDIAAISAKAEQYMAVLPMVKLYLQNSRYDKAISLIKDTLLKLGRMRKTGLAQGGEFSVENLAFKVLRRSPLIEQLRKFKQIAYDRQRSL